MRISIPRAVCFAMAAAAVLLAAPASAQIVSADVTGGKVEGTAEGDIGVFKGIPFAAPPVDGLRWQDPQPVKPWKGVKQTTAFAPACMQALPMLTMFGGEPKMSEDCLYLNVWTPAKAAGEKLPVMVWTYGGGFNSGATSIPAYSGTNFAKQGIVLVSISYRLGPFGWLAHPELSQEQGGTSGDYGLKDQMAALRWVQDNIGKFGGDPANVTIFGESAGGVSVAMLSQSPLAKGLFAKAISESGGNFAVPGSANAAGRGTLTLAAAEA
jgi:para-nitrobenzyl esterase